MRSITLSALRVTPTLLRQALGQLSRSLHPARLIQRVNGPFLACFVATVAFIYVQFPSFSYRAEMYYEMGTNFFAHAYHGSLWDNLWARDAGYLPWIPRAVSVVLVKGLGLVKWYPRAAQLAAALLIAFFAALINLREFRSFIEHDASRFLVSLGFGCFLTAHQSIVLLFNASYFAVIFLFLVLTVRKQALSWPAVLALGAAAAVCLLSKGSFIVLLPVYGVMLLYSGCRRDGKAAAFYALATAAALAQLYTVYRSQAAENLMYHARGVGYLRQSREFARDLLFYAGHSFPMYLLKPAGPTGMIQGCFLVGGLLAAAIGELLRRGQGRWVAFVAACAAAAAGSFTLTILAMPPTASWITGPALAFTPRTFVAATALHLAAVALVVRLVPRRGPQVALLGLLFLALLAQRPFPLAADETPPAEMVSQWR